MGNLLKAVHYSGKHSLPEEQRLEKGGTRPAMAAGREKVGLYSKKARLRHSRTPAGRGTRDIQVVVMENMMGALGALRGPTLPGSEAP